MCGRFTPVAQRLLKNSRSSGLDARFRIARGVPTPLRSVRARLGIVVERPWTGMTAGEALRQNHGAEKRPPSACCKLHGGGCEVAASSST